MNGRENAVQTTGPRRELYQHFALLARALGHQHRLELLELLAQGERSVEALAGAAGITLANTSQHLQQLRRVGLVASRKDGLYVFYRLADEDVIGLLRSLRRVGKRQIQTVSDVVTRYFHDRDSLEPVSRTELMTRSREGRVTILDVRPVEEYRAGHIPGATNVPPDKLAQELTRLPGNQAIVAYCRGEYCVFAYEAVSLLRKEGFTAFRLEEGFPEWKAAGLPVETAES
jgi:ArsR family transcriptional regulator